MYLFTVNRTVRFEDCDPAGILFFVKYFEFAQSALGEYWDSKEKYAEFYSHPSLTFPVYKTEGSYMTPARMGERMQIDIMLSDRRESSAEFTFRFFDEGKAFAQLKIVHVCIEKSTGTKTKLPEFFPVID